MGRGRFEQMAGTVQLAEYKLPSTVVWDSIAIAQRHLDISLTDGTVPSAISPVVRN